MIVFHNMGLYLIYVATTATLIQIKNKIDSVMMMAVRGLPSYGTVWYDSVNFQNTGRRGGLVV